jgi:hypothetical protein
VALGFKRSQSSAAKWMELEFTVLGGQFDKRKFWDRIFVDGTKSAQAAFRKQKKLVCARCAQLSKAQTILIQPICHHKRNSSVISAVLISLTAWKSVPRLASKKAPMGMQTLTVLYSH